jgi:hypothetical protein
MHEVDWRLNGQGLVAIWTGPPASPEAGRHGQLFTFSDGPEKLEDDCRVTPGHATIAWPGQTSQRGSALHTWLMGGHRQSRVGEGSECRLLGKSSGSRALVLTMGGLSQLQPL